VRVQPIDDIGAHAERDVAKGGNHAEDRIAVLERRVAVGVIAAARAGGGTGRPPTMLS